MRCARAPPSKYFKFSRNLVYFRAPGHRRATVRAPEATGGPAEGWGWVHTSNPHTRTAPWPLQQHLEEVLYLNTTFAPFRRDSRGYGNGYVVSDSDTPRCRSQNLWERFRLRAIHRSKAIVASFTTVLTRRSAKTSDKPFLGGENYIAGALPRRSSSKLHSIKCEGGCEEG